MCMRFEGLSYLEARSVLEARNGNRPVKLGEADSNNIDIDVYPGKTAPLFLPDGQGKLILANARWGFTLSDSKKLYFNTRIETAVQQSISGKGMWSRAIKEGRCLVPARAFYERHKTDLYYDQNGKQKQRQYRIGLDGSKAFLMAGLFQDGLFSIVTTAPNEYMSSIHDRMPLVLGAGESDIWLGPDYRMLADRSNIELIAKSCGED